MGGKNSFFNKPFGTGSGSVNAMFGGSEAEIAQAELSAEDKERANNMVAELEQDIAGTSDSLAIAQYEDAQEDALKSSQALANSDRNNINPALLARNVQATADMQAQDLANSSAQLRMQERQNALNSMNSYLAAQQGVSLNNAEMVNTANTANSTANKNLIGSAGAAIAKVAASDKNLKKNVKKSDSKANDKIEDFINSLSSYEFEYKDKDFGDGVKSGVMAQDLEKSELGEQMVVDTPQGKMVDFGQGFGAILAAQAELNEEIKKLKKKA